MTTIIIAGKPLALFPDTEIKLKMTNPAVTAKKARTLEFDVPLEGCARNREIFGFPDTTAADIALEELPFELYAGRLVLTGTARVTKVAAGTISLCLTEQRGEDIFTSEDYIDGLPLGKLWDNLKTKPVDASYAYRNLFSRTTNSLYDSGHPDETLPWPENQAVAFPVYLQEKDLVLNRRFYFRDAAVVEGQPTPPRHFDYLHDAGDEERDGVTYTQTELFCPQPYLCEALTRIFAHYGYRFECDDEFTRSLIIVTARNTIVLADLLPHWTLEKLIAQLTLFTGCRFTCRGGVVRLERINDEAAALQPLSRVEDEFEADLEPDNEDAYTDAATNFRFKFPTEDKTREIDPATLQGVDITDCRDYATIITSYHPDTTYYPHRIFVDNSTGYRYATLLRDGGGHTFRRVDTLPAVVRGDEGADVEDLDITPAFMKHAADAHAWFRPRLPIRWERKDDPAGYRDMLLTAQPYRKEAEYAPQDITARLSPWCEEKRIPDKPDYMELAFYAHDLSATPDGGVLKIGRGTGAYLSMDVPATDTTVAFYHRGWMRSPVGLNIIYNPAGAAFESATYRYWHPFAGALVVSPAPGITPTDGAAPVFDYTAPGSPMGHVLHPVRLATGISYTVSFLDDVDTAAPALFLHRGKLYAPQQIELTLTPRGVKPLKKATLYRLRD